MKTRATRLNRKMTKDKIHMFDCNCIVGKRADRREGEPWTLVQLLEDMDYFGIESALVSSATCRDYDPSIGNQELLNLLENSNRISPVWCVIPPFTDSMIPPTRFVDDVLSNGIKGVISYPRLHGYSLAPWSMGKLFSALNYYRVPMLLPFQQFDWEDVYTVCHEYPDLPVIATGINYRQLRYLLPLWENCSNLYVDSSWLSIADLLPFLKQRGLLEKLLFGTNYPAYTPSAAVSMITYSNVSLEDKQSVGSGNLLSLLENIKKK